VGLIANSGRLFARALWKRTSSCVAIATAVAIITTPSVRWSASPRPARLICSPTRCPPSAISRSTTAEPKAYATATVTIRADVPSLALTEITAARIGPAHGVYAKPSAAPTPSPLQKPLPRERGPKRASRVRGASIRAATCGRSSARPKPISTTSASTRTPLPARPTPCTNEASATTAIVNVSASPSTMPSGRRRPPAALADRSAGSTGSTQGVTAVAAPATSANSVRSSIVQAHDARTGLRKS
jgi:hypothetical protein